MKNFTAGRHISQGSYKSFQPEFINRKWQLDDMTLIQLLGKANRQLGRPAKKAKLLINHLYHRPVVDAKTTKKITGLTMPTAYVLLGQLEELKILKEITGDKRNRLYVFQDYVNLFR